MNNSRLWLVVSPNTGIPILLGAVVVASFSVHLAVLSKTNWYDNYVSGIGINAKTSMNEGEAAKPAGLTSNASTSAVQAGQEIEITLPDGTKATAVIKTPPMVKASYDPPERALR